MGAVQVKFNISENISMLLACLFQFNLSLNVFFKLLDEFVQVHNFLFLFNSIFTIIMPPHAIAMLMDYFYRKQLIRLAITSL